MSVFPRSWLVVLTAVVVLAAGVCPARADEKLVEPPKKVEKILGAPVVKLLQGCTKVETFRIDAVVSIERGKEYIGGYKIVGHGKDEGKDYAVRLTNVLFAETTYYGDSAKCFEPGVAFRVWCDKEWVDVVICFKCTNLAIFDGKGREIAEAHGGFGGTASEAALIKLAKEAFPDDKVIQALKEEKKK